MIDAIISAAFESWRSKARELLQNGTPPAEIVWREGTLAQGPLFTSPPAESAARPDERLTVPKSFLETASLVACHRDPNRWALLYRVAYRLTHGERNLLALEADDDTRALLLMEKAVREDVERMQALVTFRRVTDPDAMGIPELPKERPFSGMLIPPQPTLPLLRDAAKRCEGCELFRRATQVAFGEGPADARIVMVGEQPGDQEDLQGRPFVGPAGKLLDQALAEAGIRRSEVYITNAVKHFKFV